MPTTHMFASALISAGEYDANERKISLQGCDALPEKHN